MPPRTANLSSPHYFCSGRTHTPKEGLCRQNSTHLSITTAVDDGGLGSGADGAGGGAEGLELLNNLHGGLVSNLTEDDVLAIEPRGHDGGDEELGAVAMTGQKKWNVSGDSCETTTRVETYVLGPALAMDSRPGRLCLYLKFSSGNFSP